MRISGHIDKIRRSSSEVKPVEARKSTVDFSWKREVVPIGGWWFIIDRKSSPMDSRKSIFSWKSGRGAGDGKCNSCSGLRGGRLIDL